MGVYGDSPFGMTLLNLDMWIEKMNMRAQDMRLDIPRRCSLIRSATNLTELKYHLIQRAMGQS